MNRLLLAFAFFLLLSATSVASAQWIETTMSRLRAIKPLVSTRDEVKQILAEYENDNDDDYWQTYSAEGIEISVIYSSGKCSTEDEPDQDEIWNVAEWKVTKVEISFNDDIGINQAGIDISRFKKEQRHNDDPDKLIVFSKNDGIAVSVDGELVNSVTIFPTKTQSKVLCDKSKDARTFYSNRGKFIGSGFDRGEDIPEFYPNVDEVALSRSEIAGTDNRQIAVHTKASDPENDVLTYNYSVSGGKIVGQGESVIWDLTGLKPGAYMITVGVNDGCGVCGKTETKTVVVK